MLQASNRAMLKLGALTKLRRLGLAGTSVKDAGLALVAPLASLEVLNLEWCSRITNAGGQSTLDIGMQHLLVEPRLRQRLGVHNLD